MPIVKKQFKFTFLFIIAQLILAIIIMLIMNKYINSKNVFIINILFYIFIFILPVFIYIWEVLCTNPFTYLKLNEKSFNGIVKGLLISIFITLIYIIKNRFNININPAKASILFGLMLAGLFEEIPFRGFYLKVFKDRFGFWKANLITSFLFAIIHLQWILKGNIIQIVMLFIIGIWLGYIFEKIKSLWAPIIVHMVFNILTVLF